MSYNTLDEAKVALNGLNSTGEALKTDLINLVRQVSVQAQGVSANATTVLYSGFIGDVHSADIIKGMQENLAVRTVDKTVAAELLKSNESLTGPSKGEVVFKHGRVRSEAGRGPGTFPQVDSSRALGSRSTLHRRPLAPDSPSHSPRTARPARLRAGLRTQFQQQASLASSV